MANLTQLSDRKQRLLACGLCRRIWHLLTDERSRRSVEVSERYADSKATETELTIAREAAWEAAKMAFDGAITGERAPAASAAAGASSAWERGDVLQAREVSLAVAGTALQAAIWARASWQAAEVATQVRLEEEKAQDALLRDIERPSQLAIPRAGVTSTVIAIAQTIYEEQDFSPERMSLLADSLEHAGCDSDEILQHCRQQGLVHVRGCWIIDLLLAKE